jgi:hypothetical protein
VNHLAIPAFLWATLLGLIWFAAVLRAFDRQRRETLPTSTPKASERAAAAEALWSLYPDFPEDEPDTAIFLLEESRRDYNGWAEANDRIEAKATWLIGFLAVGAGLLTVFGGAQGDKAHIEPGPFLSLAMVAALGALVSCLYIVRPKLRLYPSISVYVSPRVAYASKSRFHLALSLAEEYNQATIASARERRFDPVAWAVSQGALVLAVLAILIHFGIHLRDNHQERLMINCRAQSGALHSGIALKLSCQEK